LIPAHPVSQKRILCIDDDPAILSYEKALLEKSGYSVTTAASAQEGLGLVTMCKFDAVFLDYEMPGMNGCDVAFEIKRVRPELAVILLSGSKVPSYASTLVDIILLKLGASRGLLLTIAVLCGGTRYHNGKKSGLSHSKQKRFRGEDRVRPSSIRLIAGVSCLLFGAAAWRLDTHSSSNFAARVQTSQAASTGAPQVPKPHPVEVTVSDPANSASVTSPQPTAALSTEIYTVRSGEVIQTIARRYLGKTSYLTSAELVDAIRHVNGARTAKILKANENIIIPGILPAPIVEKTIPVAKDFEVRAIALTGIMAGSDHGLRIVRQWREVGGNAVVFDVKDSDGSVNIPFGHPLLGRHKVYIHDVPKFVHFLHQQNMHAIARIAIFRDERLVVEHPELAVQSRRTHQAWRENGKLVWTDPSNPKVQDYDIAVAKHVARLGVDEIQFDYTRFPAEGDQEDTAFVFQSEHLDAASNEQDSCSLIALPARVGTDASVRPVEAKTGGNTTNPNVDSAHGASRGVDAKNETKSRRDATTAANSKCEAPRSPQRTDAITAFLKRAYAELHPTGVLLSVNVFGVMAWQHQVDLSHTGQDIVGMAKYCDVLSPMVYPSHFFGMDNIAHPGDEPAHFIGESMARFELITKGSGVVIRPWLQAFHWRTKTYSPEYIKIQVETAKAKGGIGFLFWNAANDYSKPFVAMPEMKAANAKEKDKFFRGDEAPRVETQDLTEGGGVS
jgi:CheY-like chemotaxis protein